MLIDLLCCKQHDTCYSWKILFKWARNLFWFYIFLINKKILSFNNFVVEFAVNFRKTQNAGDMMNNNRKK